MKEEEEIVVEEEVIEGEGSEVTTEEATEEPTEETPDGGEGIDGTSNLTDEQKAITENLMGGAEVSQNPIDTADYDRLLKACQDAEQMTCLPAWQGHYSDMVTQIKKSKALLAECKGCDVKKYQEAIAAYKYLIMKQVEKAELLNSYIKDHPLFVIAESDRLIGADFCFETGTLTTFSVSNKSKGRRKLTGAFDFPLY